MRIACEEALQGCDGFVQAAGGNVVEGFVVELEFRETVFGVWSLGFDCGTGASGEIA